jgi:hypothetical protein
MVVQIEGVAFPLGKINANGWGVPPNEAENAINSLKASVIRICSRLDGHICDYTQDPFSEIGRITDAWKQGDEIWAKGIITDSVAEKKISDGTWEKTWSVFASYEKMDVNGWVSGFQALSMTLVRNPAWGEAQWNIAASKGEKARLRTISQFKIISASKGGITMPENDPNNNPDATKMASLEAENRKLKEDFIALTASFESLKKEHDNTVVAAASGIPADKFNEMVETRSKVIASTMMEAYREDQAKNMATQKYTRAVMSAGLEPDLSLIKSLTAGQIEDLAASYERLVPTSPFDVASIKYPANNSPKPSCVGKWNDVEKKWEDF